MMLRFLPDINVWLALAFQAHAHHCRAVVWFESLSDVSCAFCRHTQQGFLRLCTNPAAFGSDALLLSGAWDAYDALLGDPRCAYGLEPREIEVLWRGFTSTATRSHRIWSDAYLAAFARAAGLALVSFDRGVAAYPGVDCVQP